MPTGTIPVEIAWGYGHGSPGANVWHCRNSLLSTTFNDQAEWLHDFYTAIASLFNATTTMKFLGEISGVGDDAGNLYVADPWTVTGTDSSSVAPPSLQMLVQWRAETGGRQGRGRTFIGPLAASAVESNGTPAEGARTQLLAAANDLIDTSEGDGNGAVGIYSKVGLVFRDFKTCTVPNDFAILRSRRD